MSERIILTIWGERQRSPGTGPLPTFWSLMVNLVTASVPLGVSFCADVLQWGCTEVQDQWTSTCPPFWIHLVLISLCPVLSYAILLKLVPCPLLSSFNIKSPKVGSLYGKGVWANLVWTKNVACHSSKQWMLLTTKPSATAATLLVYP